MIITKYRNKHQNSKIWQGWKIFHKREDLIDALELVNSFFLFKNLRHQKKYLYTSTYFSQHGLIEYQVLFYDTTIKNFINIESPWKIGLK